jgi:hypothetical protein
MGVGAVAGGLAGGIHGAVKGYRGNPEEEGSGGVIGALGGGLSGLGRGTLAGTAIGGAAGLASGGRGSQQVQQLTRGAYNPLGIAARMGQRQLHSVTGLVPGGAQRGSQEYIKALTQINAGGLQTKAQALATASNPQRSFVGKLLGRAAPVADPAHVMQAHQAYDAAVQAAHAGQTSVVGLGHNLAEKGLRRGGADILHAAGHEIKQQGVIGGGLMLGGAALPIAMAAASQDDPNNPTKGRNVGQAAGQGIAGALTPMIGSTGAQLIGRGGSAVGGTIGSGIDKIVGAVRRPSGSGFGAGSTTPGAQPDLASPPVQREYTNAALGKPPEGLQL